MDDRRSGLDLDGAALASLFDRVAALTADEIRATAAGPVFAAPPSADGVRAALRTDAPVPRAAEPLESLLAACGAALELGRRSAPGFFGYVLSPPTAVGVAADLIASAADQNVTAWRSAPAAVAIERQTLNWLSQFVGFGEQAGGLFLGGGSAANLTALLIALRAHGSEDRSRLCVYCSEQAHFSVDKAAAALGLQVRRVPTDRAFRLEPAALRDALDADRRRGLQPVCIVASAGTTATGAVDPLAALADLAASEGVWLHVDGAYGAPAAATRAAGPQFVGIERADSLAIDAHKWLYVPVDCGALLVRDPAASYGAFGPAGDYVRVLADEPEESFAFWDHGLELSRRSRALKLWMTFRGYGADRLALAIEEDIELAAYMGELVREHADLELLCEPSLSVCCFRHRPAGLDEHRLTAHNEALLAAVQRDGRVYLSNVTVDGKLGLRACITNFRTTRAHVRETIDLVRQLGDALDRGP